MVGAANQRLVTEATLPGKVALMSGRSTIVQDTDGKPLVTGVSAASGTARTLFDMKYRKRQTGRVVQSSTGTYTLNTTAPAYAGQTNKTWNVAETQGHCTYGGGRLSPYVSNAAVGQNIIDGSGNMDVFDIRTMFTGKDLALHLLAFEIGDVQVFVDKQPMTPFAVPMPSADSQFLKLAMADFGTYELDICIGRGVGFVQFLYPIADTSIIAPRAQDKWAVIGDSWTTGQYGVTASPVNVFAGSFMNWIKHQRGLDLFNLGQGGTGYINNPGSTYGQYGAQSRMDALALLPALDGIFVVGGGNDSGNSAAAVQAAATAYYAQLAAARPGVPVVVIGAQPGVLTDGFVASQMDATNAAIKAAALAAPNVRAYVDMRVANQPIIYGTGYQGNLKADGNADSMMSGDAKHLTFRGHKYLGLWLADILGGVYV